MPENKQESYTDAPEINEYLLSQKKAMEVLSGLGYKAYSPEESERCRPTMDHCLLDCVLSRKLCELNSFTYKGKVQKFSDRNIAQAVKDLNATMEDGLVKTNEKIYDMLMLGKSYPELVGEGIEQKSQSFTMRFIDWEHPENNALHFVPEFSVERTRNTDGHIRHARPDIVVFVNGIPVGVIECKSPSEKTEQAISQMLRNQGNDYIPQLFKFSQILLATNMNTVQYATTNTPMRFWTHWKEEDETFLNTELDKCVHGWTPTEQDKAIISLFHPQRLFELIRFFIIFDNNQKKIARYQQYYAVKKILQTTAGYDNDGKRQSGVIWHTQGSGKSLTMVMLAKYIAHTFREVDPRVILVTDRINLDKQIHTTFNHSRIKTRRATSGHHLTALLEDPSNNVITTLVHKFDTVSDDAVQFPSRDIFILVDESHRSQYGEMHQKMRKVFPNACYIGFTGTPLMKEEKSTMKRFGRLIHQYTIADGVQDRVIVPLIYEGKMVEQKVHSDAIDQRLEMITRKLDDKQKEDLKEKWSTFNRVASSNPRIELIAFDINEHFLKNFKTHENSFKGMVVADSKISAIRYQQAFEELGDLETAVIISPPDMREGYKSVDSRTKNEVNAFWEEMMRQYRTNEEYEDTLKDRFLYSDDLDLLIVVDKLLTGFDAPRATVLYIDKQMQDHSILQAIARVNRVHTGKEYGFIVDYRGLIRKLNEAMQVYSGAGLEKFDVADLQGSLYDAMTLLGELRTSYTHLQDLFAPLGERADIVAYQNYLADDKRRDTFYKKLSYFSRNFAHALQSDAVYAAMEADEIERYKHALRNYQKLRRDVKIMYNDSVDFQEYEPQMRKLIDTYVTAENIQPITEPVNIMNKLAFEQELDKLTSPASKAEAIRNRIGRSLSEEYNRHPVYVEQFRKRLNQLFEAYKTKRLTETEYLKGMETAMDDYRTKKPMSKYPKTIQDKPREQALYDLLQKHLNADKTFQDTDRFGELAEQVIQGAQKHIKVDFQNNPDVQNRIKQEILVTWYNFCTEQGVNVDLNRLSEIMPQLIKTIKGQEWSF